MKKDNDKDQPHSSFASGLFMGGILGGGLLYFFGTEKGRNRLRTILDAMEHIDDVNIDDFIEKVDGESLSQEYSEVKGNIHNILDKIQSSIPKKD